jgi:ABC-type spermidine/putrescine transport system permease subunit II
MEKARRFTLSAAAFVLICFFLPWVQVSCAGLRDSESGFDLARAGDSALWFIPLFMFAVIIIGLTRAWKEMALTFALVSTVSGLISAFLMDRERRDTSDIIGSHVTGWYWLGFVASLLVAASAVMLYFKQSKVPYVEARKD